MSSRAVHCPRPARVRCRSRSRGGRVRAPAMGDAYSRREGARVCTARCTRRRHESCSGRGLTLSLLNSSAATCSRGAGCAYVIPRARRSSGRRSERSHGLWTPCTAAPARAGSRGEAHRARVAFARIVPGEMTLERPSPWKAGTPAPGWAPLAASGKPDSLPPLACPIGSRPPSRYDPRHTGANSLATRSHRSLAHLRGPRRRLVADAHEPPFM